VRGIAFLHFPVVLLSRGCFEGPRAASLSVVRGRGEGWYRSEARNWARLISKSGARRREKEVCLRCRSGRLWLKTVGVGRGGTGRVRGKLQTEGGVPGPFLLSFYDILRKTDVRFMPEVERLGRA
jgi:hypothetical protein